MHSNGLKQDGVCRIFFSSPFNGMEGEREEFTRRYWPQIDSYCKSKGVQFVPVDMRWGITTELSDNNQTINICLGEINRSDMFVGFFGQRYGWHGENDHDLQKNFDASTPTFPWIDRYRHKSITELEFLHGHLNKPGELPAVLCFRDKSYDDQRRDEALAKSDERGVRKYSAESTIATELMDDLKTRVKATENNSLGINMCYATPEEGAKFMFDTIWKYLTEVLLKGGDKRSELEQQISDHSLYCRTKTTSYVTNESVMGKINSQVSQDSGSRVLVVTGKGGSGKTALLAKWIHRLVQQNSDAVLVYHFVGCSAESARPINILFRIVSSLHFGLESEEKADKWIELQSKYTDLKETVLAHTWVQLMAKYEEKNKKVVIVIAGLDKITYGGFEKTIQPLFWIPSAVPRGCFLILSTSTSDTRHLSALRNKIDFTTLAMDPLTLEQQHQMCKEALLLRGKELSLKQLDAVVQADATHNPLFLNIALEELCMFGKFRELDAKIDSLVTCENSVYLFDKYLDRLEKDYSSQDYEGNLVQQVACALCVSRIGLQETELIEMLNIPQNLWPPLFYGLQKYTISRQGFLRIAHVELEQAIYDRYIKENETKKLYLKKQMKFYWAALEKYIGVSLPSDLHVLKELLWTAYSSDDRVTLRQVINTPNYLLYMMLHDLEAYLFEYIQWLGLDENRLVDMFHRTFTRYMAMDYSEQQNEDLIEHPDVAEKLLEYLWSFHQFLKFAHFLHAQKRNLLRIKGIVETNTKMDPEKLLTQKLKVYMNLGQVYGENHDSTDSHKVYQEFLDLVNEKHTEANEGSEITEMRSMVYHGMSLANFQLNNFDLAEEWMMKSIETVKTCKSSATDENIKQSKKVLAEIKHKRGLIQESADMYEDIIKEEIEFAAGTLSIQMSYSYTYLGILYRKLEQYDTAKDRLDKAMKIKKTVLGENHSDVAIGYFNNANLYQDMDNNEGMVENLNKALDIYKSLGETAESNHNMLLAYDNLMMALISLSRWEEAYTTYWSIFGAIEAKFDLALGFNHENIMRYCWRTQKYEDAFKILKLLLVSSHIQPQHFVFLYHLRNEDLIPAEKFDDTMTLDTGIEKYPSNEELLLVKVESAWIPVKDSAVINKQIEKYLSYVSDEQEKIVCLVAEKCCALNWKEGAIEVYEYWREKLPNPEAIVRNLAVVYFDTQQLDKATDCFKQAIELNPNLWILQDKLVLLLMLQGRVDEAEQELKVLGDRFNAQPEVPDKVKEYLNQINDIREYLAKQEQT